MSLRRALPSLVHMDARRRTWRWRPKVLAYGPLLAQLVVTRRCNLSCGYCNEYDGVSAPVPTELLKARVDKLASLGLLFCEYTGGETLLHPDIIELVRYASSYNFDERWIITNGYLLSPEIVNALNDAGLTHLQISIDGVTPNETTVKVLKPLRKKIEHLQKHAKFAVQINAVLGAGNDEEVLE
ncbi:MAG TPA: radical SAM protein, partial [Kofleriaceae bacterium]|nr:radical SAM protein [Kofleriaceae bacterium]